MSGLAIMAVAASSCMTCGFICRWIRMPDFLAQLSPQNQRIWHTDGGLLHKALSLTARLQPRLLLLMQQNCSKSCLFLSPLR